MLDDFINSLHCVREAEAADYHNILIDWKDKKNNVAFMPAITWYAGTCNLFEQKAGNDGRNMIWIIPAGQHDFYWLNSLRRTIVGFCQQPTTYRGGGLQKPC